MILTYAPYVKAYVDVFIGRSSMNLDGAPDIPVDWDNTRQSRVALRSLLRKDMKVRAMAERTRNLVNSAGWLRGGRCHARARQTLPSFVQPCEISYELGVTAEFPFLMPIPHLIARTK